MNNQNIRLALGLIGLGFVVSAFFDFPRWVGGVGLALAISSHFALMNK